MVRLAQSHTQMTSTELPHPHLRDEASTDALPIAPALGASLDAARMPRRSTLVEPRVLLITTLALALGVAGWEQACKA